MIEFINNFYNIYNDKSNFYLSNTSSIDIKNKQYHRITRIEIKKNILF